MFGISADMHKLPLAATTAACGRTWPPYRVDRQIIIGLPPSDYLRKLSFDTVFIDQERIITLHPPIARSAVSIGQK
jgi:hypothetical protein